MYVTATGVTSPAVPEARYTYVDPPTVTSVTPNQGPTAGGQTATIRGTGFTGATDVKFGGVSGTGLTVVNSTKITVTTPAHAAGLVNLFVTTGNGSSAANSGTQYTYRNAPTVTSVSPGSGTTAGGQTVTITGTNLTGTTAVKFSNTAATSFTVVSATKITAVTPARSSGVTNILVTTGGGTSAVVSADHYTFV